MMFSALLLQQLWKSSWTEGRETPMTLSAPLTMTYCNTIRQNALHHTTVEGPEDADGERLVTSVNTASAGPFS